MPLWVRFLSEPKFDGRKAADHAERRHELTRATPERLKIEDEEGFDKCIHYIGRDKPCRLPDKQKEISKMFENRILHHFNHDAVDGAKITRKAASLRPRWQRLRDHLLQGLSRNGAYVTIAIFKQFKKGRNSGTELLPWSGRLPKAIAARTFSSEAEM